MDTRHVVARFEAERQALAIMDHPHIAKVFDGGTTPSGRPYFVMELVRGVPITEFCDQYRVTLRHRLELFISVCQAVQHAHQKGIIHRDLKPSNVLVSRHDTTPIVKVIDFGVAKALGQELTDKTIFTGIAQMIGTPLYMSPEQAGMSDLDVDTCSDIYSLGVLLYELLTGTTPFCKERFKQAAYDEIRRIIREEEPPKPSSRLSQLGSTLVQREERRGEPPTSSLEAVAAQRHMEPAKLTKLVRGELDWIVMKALEKDRSRRYETANGFAMDVQRYLADEQVLACPPSAGYRLQKFMRRNKAALAMVSVLTLAILFVVGSLGWMARDRTAREQEIARDRAARQLVIKERVELALEDASKRHQEGRWREALDAAKRAEALAVTGGSDAETYHRAREVLGDMQMLAKLEKVRADSTKNEAGFDLKEEDRGIARAFREYGMDIDALDRDVAAMRIKARPIRFELAVFLDSWSYVRRRLEAQSPIRAGKNWRELLEVARVADPDPWRDQFRKAVLNDDRQALVQLAASAPLSSLPAETVDRLGGALMASGAFEEAAAFLKKGQRVHPQDYWINANLGICLSQLGPGHHDDVIRYFTAALALRPEAAQSHSNLGNALSARKKPDEAIEHYLKAIDVTTKALELTPHQAKYWRDRGDIYARFGKYDKAIVDYSQAIKLEPQYAHFWNQRGNAYYGLKQPDKALSDFTKALELNPQDPTILTNRGTVYLQLGQYEKAIADCSRAIELRPDNVNAWHHRALAQEGLRRWKESLTDHSRAIDLAPKNPHLHICRGRVLAQLEEWQKAATAFEHATALKPDYPLAWYNLALAELQRGDRAGYRKVCSKMLENFGQSASADAAFWTAWTCVLAPNAIADRSKLVEIAARANADDGQKCDMMIILGAALYRAGRFEEAAHRLAEVDAVSKLTTSKRTSIVYNWIFQAMAHHRLGHTAEASAWLKKAVQELDKPSPKAAQDPASNTWNRRLTSRLLRREAEELLAKTSQ